MLFLSFRRLLLYARPNISQFQSRKYRPSTFPNNIKIVDQRVFGDLNCEIFGRAIGQAVVQKKYYIFQLLFTSLSSSSCCGGFSWFSYYHNNTLPKFIFATHCFRVLLQLSLESLSPSFFSLLLVVSEDRRKIPVLGNFFALFQVRFLEEKKLHFTTYYVKNLDNSYPCLHITRSK